MCSRLLARYRSKIQAATPYLGFPLVVALRRGGVAPNALLGDGMAPQQRGQRDRRLLHRLSVGLERDARAQLRSDEQREAMRERLKNHEAVMAAVMYRRTMACIAALMPLAAWTLWRFAPQTS